ncbi:unnamed protein product [Ostreobium quekettii]|uniref:Uncharacterized protein n=1 Tax=Ostreobium quekettii TaxID=121088 RepID=A0A8S1J7H8_9CHLO|nr:unnamed protein product [Ostreobium quekettii]|eukprot:evm.model.scf_228.10 EVM.evm.TU.scf_228.10   scf_228:82510-88017(-)
MLLAHLIRTRQSGQSRADAQLDPSCFGLPVYLAYALYPPLYIAGPISSFNNFAHQIYHPDSPSLTKVCHYGLRLLGCLLALEVLTHTIYANAIAKYRLWHQLQLWGAARFSPLDLSTIGFWVLMFMWLKFLVIWRFFRLWSLADGIDAPENMTRCLCNNYDIEGFWKNWHASYNLWLVRYIYIPLGGARWRALNVWAIFTFVGLWHDLEWKLVSWAWIMCLFIGAEMAAKLLSKHRAMAPLKRNGWFRHLAAVVACSNVLALMTANMVGFVLGVDGISDYLHGIFSDVKSVCIIFAAIFSTVQVMFEMREYELHEQRRVCPVA